MATITQVLDQLRSENIQTWFDLGLFLDRLHDNRAVPSVTFDGGATDFQHHIGKGIAFVSFYYAIDGATVEVLKYAKAFRDTMPSVAVHFVAGRIDSEVQSQIDATYAQQVITEIQGFDDWPLYKEFFHQRLDRGGESYNGLIRRFWDDVLTIVWKLGSYVEDNEVRLLYLVNTNSNPGNVALALANVLLSEMLEIPVISNNHDFYWEGGDTDAQRKAHNERPGPRDHFFTNAHLGEVFSVIEMVYPWDSRSWLAVNINDTQGTALTSRFGHNPVNVAGIGTSIDIDAYAPQDSRNNAATLTQVASLFRGDASTLRSEAATDLLQRCGPVELRQRPRLISWKAQAIDFEHGNVVILQPTRILPRKCIEVDFELVQKLMTRPQFASRFRASSKSKLTVLVTGPVAIGHDRYLQELLRAFATMLEQVDESLRDRIYLGLLFAGLDSTVLKERRGRPTTINDLYNIASLVVLPSETEGRGLPILEAAAAGVPMFVRRYEPEEVYAQVIGEHLSEDQRLRVIETDGSPLHPRVVARVEQQLLELPYENDDTVHNRRVVGARFKPAMLQDNVRELLEQLRLQLAPDVGSLCRAGEALSAYCALVTCHQEKLRVLIDTEHRQYLPGFSQMAFMIYLKSLIDPSYFRVEEQQVRGMAWDFARHLVESTPPIPRERQHEFYNTVDALFRYREGANSVRHDHAMAYRHRNTHYLPYRDLTPQELTGVINLIHEHYRAELPSAAYTAPGVVERFASWGDLVVRLFGPAPLALDNRNKLEERLDDNVPVAYFTGQSVVNELQLFAVHRARVRLGLGPNTRVTEEALDAGEPLAPIFIFKRRLPLGDHLDAAQLERVMVETGTEELKLLLRRKLCQIVPTDQRGVGLDFRQLGERPLEVLLAVRAQGGFLLAHNRHAAMMTDIVDLERFHIGRATSPLEAHILGIPEGSGYVQWVPAGLRFCLGYPTPVQTGADLSRTLNSDRYRRLCGELGEAEVHLRLKQAGARGGTPVANALEELDRETDVAETGSIISHSSTNGVYADGLPWSGVVASIRPRKLAVRFKLMRDTMRPKSVLEFVEEFRQSGGMPLIAWNGGYILNPELVGKLALPESYVGTPLGLIITDGNIVSPPLFNKPAFLVRGDGLPEIRRVNACAGLTLSTARNEVALGPEQRNPDEVGDRPAFYDLMYTGHTIPAAGRVVVRLAGNRVMEVIEPDVGEQIEVLPVGLTLTFPVRQYPDDFQVDCLLRITMMGWPVYEQAIEAGPLLMENGRECLDMELEGWTTELSIRTQAARLDYTDMRGPKIAVGIDGIGQVHVVAINGRIRESVGAMHGDMASIMRTRGMVSAMGFDPGGSSTLVVGTRPLNISPYNADYEADIHSLPPQPRFVATAVIGYEEEHGVKGGHQN